MPPWRFVEPLFPSLQPSLFLHDGPYRVEHRVLHFFSIRLDSPSEIILGLNGYVVLQGMGEQGSFLSAFGQDDTLLPCSQYRGLDARHVDKFQDFLFREIRSLFSSVTRSNRSTSARHMAMESSDIASSMWKISSLSVWTIRLAAIQKSSPYLSTSFSAESIRNATCFFYWTRRVWRTYSCPHSEVQNLVDTESRLHFGVPC